MEDDGFITEHVSEATATGLPHPTPRAIKLACYDAAKIINRERRRNDIPALNADWLSVIVLGIEIANARHHK